MVLTVSLLVTPAHRNEPGKALGYGVQLIPVRFIGMNRILSWLAVRQAEQRRA